MLRNGVSIREIFLCSEPWFTQNLTTGQTAALVMPEMEGNPDPGDDSTHLPSGALLLEKLMQTTQISPSMES